MASAQTSADFPLASAQTFAFGKRTFVSGLFWQPLPGSTARLRKAELKKMSEEQDFDLAVQRTSGVPQVGFGAAADGVKAGMLSVAAMVSKSLEVANRDRSFLCAMQVPGGNWIYVAQREGVVLHDGDLLGSEETIRARMMTDMSLIEWQTVFAPKHWGIPHAIERTFEELLPKRGTKYSFKSWWEIRPIRNTWLDAILGNWMVSAGAIVLVVGFGGFYLWQQWQTKKAIEALAQQEAIEQAARAAAIAEHPWKKIARATKFVAACDAALGQVNTFWPGNWTPRDAICAGNALKVTWLRQEQGWVEHLLEIEPKAVPSADGNAATLTVPLTLGSGDNEIPPKQAARSILMYGAAQRYGVNFSINKSAAPALGQPTVADHWKPLAWSVVSTGLKPSTVIPALDGDGFRVSMIKLTFTGGMMKWTMEGTQYVQP